VQGGLGETDWLAGKPVITGLAGREGVVGGEIIGSDLGVTQNKAKWLCSQLSV